MRWGYRRLHLLLIREGVVANHKRIYRLYREESLAVRRRKRKRVAVVRRPMPAPQKLNDCWAMDFMSDVLSSGRTYRVLNIVDTLSREALASEVDTSLPSARVIRALEEIAVERGYPARITCDNGPEFRSMALDAWAYEHRVTLDFIQPGKPIQNSLCESFNGRMRDECLNSHWWRSIQEARKGIEEYRRDYNEARPHSALNNRTPAEFAAERGGAVNPQRLVS